MNDKERIDYWQKRAKVYERALDDIVVHAKFMSTHTSYGHHSSYYVARSVLAKYRQE